MRDDMDQNTLYSQWAACQWLNAQWRPNRFQEKGNLEVLLFTIQSRMRANNQRVYTPKDGALVADINRVRRRTPQRG